MRCFDKTAEDIEEMNDFFEMGEILIDDEDQETEDSVLSSAEEYTLTEEARKELEEELENLERVIRNETGLSSKCYTVKAEDIFRRILSDMKENDENAMKKRTRKPKTAEEIKADKRQTRNLLKRISEGDIRNAAYRSGSVYEERILP